MHNSDLYVLLTAFIGFHYTTRDYSYIHQDIAENSYFSADFTEQVLKYLADNYTELGLN